MGDPVRYDPNIDDHGPSGGTGEIRQDGTNAPEPGEDVARREAAREEARRAQQSADAADATAREREAAAQRARAAEQANGDRILELEQRGAERGFMTPQELNDYRAAVAQNATLRSQREAADEAARTAREQADHAREAAHEAAEAVPEPPGEGKPAGRYKAAQNASPRQCYQVAVPHANTRLTFGASASRGGSGASLTTDGSVMLDSCGPTDVQAAGNLSLQTNASFAAISESGTLIGTPEAICVQAGANIKVWAGSAVAPGECGSGKGADVAKPNADGPASRAEKFVAAAMLPTAIGKTAADLTGFASGNPLDMIAAAGDTLSNAGTLVGTANTLAGGSSENGAGQFSEMAATWGDNISAAGGKNVFGAVAGTAAATSLAGAGGETKVDIQGPAGISMLTNAKITGTATGNIEFKTAVKFSVNAASVAEMVTQQASIFAMVKAEMKGGAICNLMSFGVIGLEAPAVVVTTAKMKVNALSYSQTSTNVVIRSGRMAVNVKTILGVKASTMVVDSEMKVVKKSLFKSEVDVKGEAKMSRSLKVKEAIEAKSEKLKKKLEVLGSLVAG